MQRFRQRRQFRSATRALDEARADITAAPGLPPRLTLPVPKKRFGDRLQASSDRFSHSDLEGLDPATRRP
ncbi:MAG TPA: hypothetical protein VLN90_00345 [Thioalkalivibrio sp.]|nr:hypothetical protein [Thioalkalivibrio sp.]